jgi:hypothetical protein
MHKQAVPIQMLAISARSLFLMMELACGQLIVPETAVEHS